jgi:hypothetical protein
VNGEIGRGDFPEIDLHCPAQPCPPDRDGDLSGRSTGIRTDHEHRRRTHLVGELVRTSCCGATSRGGDTHVYRPGVLCRRGGGDRGAACGRARCRRKGSHARRGGDGGGRQHDQACQHARNRDREPRCNADPVSAGVSVLGAHRRPPVALIAGWLRRLVGYAPHPVVDRERSSLSGGKIGVLKCDLWWSEDERRGEGSVGPPLHPPMLLCTIVTGRGARSSARSNNHLEGCESGRIGRSRKPLCRKAPWVRIPLPPPTVCHEIRGQTDPQLRVPAP